MTDICQAINDLHLISFDYDNHPRVVEPHTYGMDTRGHEAVRAYQVRGWSKSSQLPEWRVFHRDKMYGVSMLQETFAGPRDGYRRGDPFFDTIYCEL
jgi:hypothetical protein